MYYSAMQPIRVYNNLSQIPLPKDDKVGFNDAVFILTKSQSDTLSLLNSNTLGYNNAYYKYYYIDAIYNERIGFKKIIKNNNSLVKNTFKNTPHPSYINEVQYSSRMNFFTQKKNVIVDLSIWMDYFFKFRLMSSTKNICENYITFLAGKINNSLFNDYNKTIIIDVSYWFKDKILSFDRKDLNDPLTLLLYAMYKTPEITTFLSAVDILIIDSTEGKAMKIPGEMINKKNYSKIKSKLAGFDKLKNIENVKDDPETTNEDSSVVDKISTDKEKIIQQSRINIINSVKKNFVGEIEDTTDEIEDEDVSSNENDEILKTDSPMDDEIDSAINEYLDENPELVDQVNPETAIKEVSDHVKKRVYIAKFMPEKSQEVQSRIDTLQKKQEEVIGLPSFKSLDSKIIDESDYSEYVKTNNPNIVKSTFANFDHSYNMKKLDQDIDDAVGILQDASTKIFITDKSEEDTSDQLNLKKTVTYKLEDENGKKMKLKFDIPIIIDDKYFYLNGAKKIIQHQLVLKPIVKTAPDTVQIVAFYNKIFITRKGNMDLAANTLLKMLTKDSDTYKVKFGNSNIKNGAYNTTLEFDIIAKNIYSFTIGQNKYITEIDALKDELKKYGINYATAEKNGLLIGYNKSTKTPIVMKPDDNYVKLIASTLNEDQQSVFNNYASSKRLMYAECTIMEEHIPLILIMLFFEGFASVMEKSKIEYHFVSDKKELKNYDKLEWGFLPLENGTIIWKRYPLQNSLLMNGLQSLPTELYSFEELESKDTYIFMLSQFHKFANQYQNLDQFKDFMIDGVTKEILMDYHLPTDIVSLMAYAAILLVNNDFMPENNFNNLRVRSNELIAYFTYNQIAHAYNPYRKSLNKKNPTSITIKQDSIIKDLKKSKLIEDSSTLNPVLELEKNRAVSYKGERGINLEQAMTLPRRGYDESMLGVVGISTSPDSNVGVVRQLTLEPTITSTRGYIDTHTIKSVDNLNSANLLTPAELLTPLGVQHDDPTRTSIKL